MSQEDIRVRQQERFDVLKTIYDLSKGNPSEFVAWRGVGNQLNFDDQKVIGIIRYFSQEGLVKPVTTHHVQITNFGVNEIEHKLTNPQNPTEHFPQNVIIIGNMQNSAIQQGTVNSSQIVTISSNDLEKILEFVSKFEQPFSELELKESQKTDIESDIQVIKSTAKSSKPKKEIIGGALRSISEILRNVPSAKELLSELQDLLQDTGLDPSVGGIS